MKIVKRIDTENYMDGNILLTMCTGDLDDIANGTYGKVLSTAISAGKINLVSGVVGSLPVENTDADVTADNPQAVGWLTDAGALALKDSVDFATAEVVNKVLDNITDGATYARVLKTDITAGHILLSACSGALDDISDGTYGKVLTTGISAGNILLTMCAGDLDDIANGTYGKVLSTAISAGKIVLTGGGGVDGVLPVGNTAAKCTDATADQTSANTAADTVLVQGETILTGNYISTPLLTATNIQAGTLTLSSGGTNLAATSGTVEFNEGANLKFKNAAGSYGVLKFHDEASLGASGTATFNMFADRTGTTHYIGYPQGDANYYGGLKIGGTGDPMDNHIVGSSWLYGLNTIRLQAGLQSSPAAYLQVAMLSEGVVAGIIVNAPHIRSSGTVDLGTTTNKFQHLYLSGNITVDGTVDGVDIAARDHAQSHSAASHSDITSSGTNIDSAVSLRHAQSHNTASHSDIVITSVANNELLTWDTGSARWINRTAAEAGLSVSGHSHNENSVTFDDSTGHAHTGAAGNGSVISWSNLSGKPTSPSLEEMTAEHAADGTHEGADSTYTVVTNVRIYDYMGRLNLQKKTRSITVANGIVTTVGAESANWENADANDWEDA